MKYRGLWVVFIIGCAILIIAFGLGWAEWGGEFAGNMGIVSVLIGALVFILGFLVASVILIKDRQKWLALALASVLLLGFSAFTIFSVGLVTAPLSFIFLVIALWKLLRH